MTAMKEYDGPSPIILIYSKVKGFGQIVRNLLCYLKVKWIDLHVETLEEGKKQILPFIQDSLKGIKISLNQLPVLIHEGTIIYQLFPIMFYLCYQFNHEQLLGRDIFEQSSIQEIVELYRNNLYTARPSLFQFAEEIFYLKQNGEELLPFIQEKFDKFCTATPHIQYGCKKLLRQNQVKFIFGDHITLVDFYFFQTSRYMIGVYGSLNYQICNQSWKNSSYSYFKKKQERGEKINNFQYLTVMHQYHNYIKKQQFYEQNQNYLSSYYVAGKNTGQAQIKGLLKLWASDVAQLFKQAQK